MSAAEGYQGAVNAVLLCIAIQAKPNGWMNTLSCISQRVCITIWVNLNCRSLTLVRMACLPEANLKRSRPLARWSSLRQKRLRTKLLWRFREAQREEM